MKRMGILLRVLVMVIGLSVSAYATLIDMNDGTIYDTDTQLSWLKDADTGGLKSWNQAVVWAASLNADGGFAGLTGWRLPTSDTCSGYNCTNSEMGHLYYTEMGNPAGGHRTNTGPFIDLELSIYWSGTTYERIPSYAWEFFFTNGNQYQYLKTTYHIAWAVSPGERTVSSVPEPSTFLLFGGGLAGVGILRRRFKR